ncbi:MAG: hypothetical protein ABGY24_09760 [bacterium]
MSEADDLVQHPPPQHNPHSPQHLVRQRTKRRIAMTMTDAPMMIHLKSGTEVFVVFVAGGGGG